MDLGSPWLCPSGALLLGPPYPSHTKFIQPHRLDWRLPSRMPDPSQSPNPIQKLPMIPSQFIKPAVLSAIALTIVPFVVAAKRAPAPAFDAEAAGTYSVDAAHSHVGFRIKHLGAAFNYGRFNKLEGDYVLSEEEGKSTVKIVVEVASVDTNNEDRDKHLRNVDFFNAVQFPKITFESSKFVKKEGDTYAVTGNLTLHGKTKEITVDMEMTGANDAGERFGFRSGLETTFTIDRNDYDITIYPDMLGKEVTMTVALEGKRK